MPLERQPFDSGLPRVAEFEPMTAKAEKASELAPRRERALQERVKLLWDTYQDLKSGWVAFVRSHREKITKKPPKDSPSAEELSLPYLNLLDSSDPLSKEFHATPKFQAFHRRLRELWADEEVCVGWKAEMQKSAGEWAEVNGNFEAYQELAREIKALEVRLDTLRKEQFDERGKSARVRRRTLKDDLVDTELALEETRSRERALSEANPALAARILAAELKQRHRELHSKNGFMWFGSRRAIKETMAKLIAEKDTLRMIVLEGEAGTGKTTMAKMLARHFTGQDPLTVEVGEKTKVDRALFADETLDPQHPTVYRPMLYALTGKRRPGGKPEHQGRAVFVDEFNKLSNDEGGIAATALDRIKSGEPTGYHLFGADPTDPVQPQAIVIAGQNPAGGRFRRTEFTPEVKRKLEILQLEYFTQTPEDPELFEAFLVASKDADGRITGKQEEFGPQWSAPVLSPDATFKQKQLQPGPKNGGALWRVAQMLHESYENLYKRKNALTDANLDAHLQGRVLPPGDIFQWLGEYQTEVKRGAALQDFLALKLHTWLESAFKSAGDQEDKRLYSELAEQFGFLENAEAGQPPLYLPLQTGEKITPDLLSDREIAELSPRVPRPKLPVGGTVEAGELTRVVFDFTTPQGTFFRAVEARILPLEGRPGRLTKKGTTAPVYIVRGTIKECARFHDLVNQLLLEDSDRPDQKIIVPSLEEFEEVRTPETLTRFTVANALNPYREAFLAGGISNTDPATVERKDLEVDLEQILAADIASYRATGTQGLEHWASALEAVRADLRMTPEKRAILEQEIQDGAIPIFMPGRAAQLATTPEQYQKGFIPGWIKDGVAQTLEDTYLWEHTAALIRGKDASLVKGIPERPYILLAKPTAKVDARTTSKTVDQQQQELIQINRERTSQGKPRAQAANPAGWGALVRRSAEITKTAAPQPLTTLVPIDNGNNSYCRFIDLPLSSDGYVPFAFFNPGSRQLVFDGSDAAGANPEGGFRLEVRVEV